MTQRVNDTWKAVRPPAVAGQFYADSPDILRRGIEEYMIRAVTGHEQTAIALILPHAGYIYSGQIAADGYNQVRGQKIDTVVILGTNHTVPGFHCGGLYPGRGFQTPSGVAEIDQEIMAHLLERGGGDFVTDEKVHTREHSIEVQVPFVQVLFPQAKIVPVQIGGADPNMCERLGVTLGQVLKDRHALIVASTDLSHYPSAEDAPSFDLAVLDAMITLNPLTFKETIKAQMNRRLPNLQTCACGEGAVMAAITAASFLGARGGRVVSYAHSGDSLVGDQGRVVGYGAVALTKEAIQIDSRSLAQPETTDGELQPEDKKALLIFAREAITRYLTTQTLPLARDFSPFLQQQRGVFVTIHNHKGALRGCIGNLVSHVPLPRLVGMMSLQSGLKDPRFSPVRIDELKNLTFEISVLTPMKQVSGYEDIEAGRDGVVLRKDGRSAVFLPQVAAEQGWGRDEMLNHLAAKAGLPREGWRQGASFSTFQAVVFREEDFGLPEK
ncbi:MAG: AmmeMemoRadiSam system protein B [Syntrophobacterales bacterium]|nr:AmmeMemoRadiSam system protein B [Syntrophobacterales bacterium]